MNRENLNMSEETGELFSADGETEVVRRFIRKGAVVFDIGANVGDWSALVFRHQSDVQVHSFEPVPATDRVLREKLAPELRSGAMTANCVGIGRAPGERSFIYYDDASSWSTFYRRKRAEKEAGLKEARTLTVPVTSIDSYCDSKRIQHIDFMKVDTEGAELDVLLGAQRMLQRGGIDHVQFEYGGTYLDAGITLRTVFELMESHRYGIFKIAPGGVEYLPVFREEYENFEYSNFLAVNERLVPSYLGLPPKMLNLRALLLKHRIRPRGVIHIGAHEGGELEKYLQMGAERVLFVEANPETYQRLAAAVGAAPGVLAVQCAVADHDGTATLHVTSMDQSSSILPLKRHREIYPDIVEEKTVTVPCRTLDSLMGELGLDTTHYNIINIDIQGAELIALKGGEKTLAHIEAINSEINYDELYEGCATVWELDVFLEERGFERVATTTPYHPSWGDGFYVKRGVVSMSSLGTNGRFANQIFQYAFLRTYTLKHMLSYETPPWIGQQLFGHKDPPISRQRPLFEERSSLMLEAVMPNSPAPFKGVDFWGYFQYHTSYYRAHREFFRTLFQPVPPLKKVLDEVYRTLSSLGRTVVGLHLRRGDYGYGYFFVAPNRWYLDWLQEIWPTLDDPVLFIASDEPDEVLADFAPYRPVTIRTLGIALQGAEFYPDFYLLSRCDVTAISNSSFSFAACMLNTGGSAFFRPSLSLQRLIPFDPWDSEVLLRDATLPESPAPASQGAGPSGSKFSSRGFRATGSTS